MTTTGNFRYKLTRGENHVKKPHGYARETNAIIDPEARTNVGTSSQFSIRGISECYHCKSQNITEDTDRAEIYCFSCGTVLRQGFKSYMPDIFSSFQKTSREHEAIKYKKTHG